MHELLRRQIREHLGSPDAPPADLAPLLDAVDRAYRAADERDRAAAALREGDRPFRLLAETVAAATFVYQGNRFRYVNAAAERLTGHPREALLAMDFWAVVHPDDRETIRTRGLARLRGEAVPDRYEFRIVTRDGRVRWVDFTAGVVEYEGETAALGTAFDVTAHHDADEALRLQALAFENLYDAVILTDTDGVIVDVNPAAERLYGWPEAEVLGRTVKLWHLPREAEGLERRIQGALERDGRWQGEVDFVRRDGTRGVSETVVVPLRDGSGARVGALGVSRDVTERRRAEEALRSTEDRMRLMAAGSTPAFFFAQDAEGRFEVLSPAVLEVLGWPAEALRGHTSALLREADREADAAAAGRLRDTLAHPGRLSTFLSEVRHRDGRARVLEITETAVLRGGKVRGVQGVARDVTDRIAADHALRESEARYRALFEDSRDAIFIGDAAGLVTDANQAAVELFGLPRDQLARRPLESFFLHDTDRQRVRDELLRSGFVRDTEVRLRRADGQILDCLLSATVRTGPASRRMGVQGIVHDITARKRAEAQLAYGALHDGLTMLPNRALFVDRLQAALDRVRRGAAPGLAVLFLDVDRFKVVNDSLGHGTGDALLVAIAHRLAAALRTGDTVARFGGDEFVILLDDLALPSEATMVAGRLLDALAAPFPLGSEDVFTGASVGVAVSTSATEDAEEMLRNADAALSRAKVLGKGRYEVFDRRLHAEAVQRLRLEGDLRRAVDRGEFGVRYQPIVDVGSGRVCGFEALVRWRHPERGLVLPAAFIPLAEETGLIRPIGRFVLEEACRQLAVWEALFGGAVEGGLSMAVNLSARQFEQPELASWVRSVIQENGVEPARLRLEITETVVLENVASVAGALADLQALGVGLCMDDFGTGYASLASLHRLPLDVVKIDRSFVQRMEDEPRNARLVEAIVALARSLGVRVVAEGVETSAQLDALRRMGCDYAQGYLFAPPLPAEEAEALLAGGPAW